jgi:hypothetical protein
MELACVLVNERVTIFLYLTEGAWRPSHNCYARNNPALAQEFGNHTERNYQGFRNQLIQTVVELGKSQGENESRNRLGGMLRC